MKGFLKIKKNYEILLRSFFIAFFLYQIIYVLFKPELSLYTLNLTKKELFLELIFIAIISALYIKFLNKEKNNWNVFYIVLLSYLIIFMIRINILTIALGIISIIGIVLLFIKNKVNLKVFKNSSILIGIISILKIGYLILNNERLVAEKSSGLSSVYYWINFRELTRTNYILYGIIAIFVFLFVYMVLIKKLWKNEDILFKIILSIVIILAIIQITYLTLILITRVISFQSETYDMGIFTQMFYNMDKGNGPVTTIERDRLLSHFKVHISPIFYLLLPFFKLFPSPITLQVLQVLIVTSGVIPIYKIAKTFNLNKLIIILLIGVYFLVPPIWTGNLFDLHENCFLAPLVLWLFYSVQKNNKLSIIIFVILTLMVKEDAGIYVVFIGLYFLFNNEIKLNKNDRIFNLFVLVVTPIVIFLLSIMYLSKYGDGAMLDRYSNLSSYPMLGVKGIIISFIQNFSYYISLIFKTSKIYYILSLFFSLTFLPLFQRAWYNYFLICPSLIVNLLSDYPQQHGIYHQYNYGSVVLLIIMLTLTLKYIQENHTKNGIKFITVILLSAIVFSSVTLFNIYKSYKPFEILNNKEKYTEIRGYLDEIPKDAKVLSDTLYTVHLRKDVEKLYDLRFHNDLEVDVEIDYLIIAVGETEELSINTKNKYIEAGYKLSDLSNKYLEIYEK